MRYLALLSFSLAVSASADLLIIGDSHSAGIFGDVLQSELLKALPNLKLSFYASCGSTLSSWNAGKYVTHCGYRFKDAQTGERIGMSAPTPDANELIQRLHPDLIVVEMGTNYFVTSEAFLEKDITWLNQKTAGTPTPCVWIGPPDSRKFPPAVQAKTQNRIEARTRCTYFKSTAVTHYPAAGGDGIHYNFKAGMPIARAWARAASVLVLEKLNTP